MNINHLKTIENFENEGFVLEDNLNGLFYSVPQEVGQILKKMYIIMFLDVYV